MDPITAVSTLGAVLGIIDVVTKTINGLRELGAQYKDAELTIFALVSQLTALRAALTKTREWIDSERTETHYQLAMDLGDTLSCCGMLTAKLEGEVERLRHSTNGKLKALSKLKFALSGKSIEDVQDMVSRLTSALNLVLTAYNCQSISEQHVMLESSSSRQAFKAIEKDVSSLYVHQDSASIITKLTDRLSLFSKEFAFDRALWLSKVYRDASPRLWEAMRERARQKYHARQQISTEAEELRLSQSIDQIIERDRSADRDTAKVLLLSTAPGLSTAYMRAIKRFSDDKAVSDEELDMLRPRIQQAAMSLMTKAASLVLEDVDSLPQSVGEAVAFLSGASQPSDLLSPKAAQSLRELWGDSKFHRLAPTHRLGPPSSVEYIVENVDRIIADDYFPTSQDASRICVSLKSIEEVSFTHGTNSFKLCSIGNQLLKSRRWMRQVAHTPVLVLFLVDLASYDRVTPDGGNEMEEAIQLFDSVANSRFFLGASMAVLFSNASRFRSKMVMFPVQFYFSDFKGRTDFTEAFKYFANRFCCQVRGYTNCHVANIEPEDYGLYRWLAGVVKDQVIDNNLRRIGII